MRDLIRRKNRAFAILEKAERELDRRRRRHLLGQAGPVPTSWLRRREELAEAYERAKAAVGAQLRR